MEKNPSAPLKSHWKKWTADDLLDNTNWDFSELIEWEKSGVTKEIEAAWLTELDRELGLSGDSFIKNWKKQNGSFTPQSTTPSGIKEVIFYDALKQAQERTGQTAPMISWGHKDFPTQRIMFEIDWSKPRAEIIESFRFWLENLSHPPAYAFDLAFAPKGRRNQFKSWLKELAIYRFHSAGVSHKNALPKLAKFFTSLEHSKKHGPEKISATVSAQYWSHAAQRTVGRILQRQSKLITFATRHEKGWKAGTPFNPDVQCNWKEWLGKLR